MDPLEWMGIGMGGLMVAGMAVALLWGSWSRGRQEFDVALECQRCGSHDVEALEAGVRCRACGYDTTEAESPEDLERIEHIQELGIALACLESAARELQASKSHGGGPDSKRRGPYPDKYLEGLEQAAEARRIALRLQLDDVVGALADLPVVDGSQPHDACADAATETVLAVHEQLEGRRDALREAFGPGAEDQT